jgi:hypothetical protein
MRCLPAPLGYTVLETNAGLTQNPTRRRTLGARFSFTRGFAGTLRLGAKRATPDFRCKAGVYASGQETLLLQTSIVSAFRQRAQFRGRQLPNADCRLRTTGFGLTNKGESDTAITHQFNQGLLEPLFRDGN